jgi:hypothetical protein
VDDIELKIDNFKRLVQSALAKYNRHEPWEAKFNLQLEIRSIQFTPTSVDQQGNLIGIPDMIPDLMPVRLAGVSPFFLREFEGHHSEYLDEKVSFPWEYRKPSLYVPITGQYDVHAAYFHIITPVLDSNNAPTKDLQVTTMDDTFERFFNLLTARFMKGLAASRRAFTVQDMPITSDATEMLRDGLEKEKQAIQDIEDNTAFWLAWG